MLQEYLLDSLPLQVTERVSVCTTTNKADSFFKLGFSFIRNPKTIDKIIMHNNNRNVLFDFFT